MDEEISVDEKIVLYVSGMGAVGRAFLGSVSDYLVHNCDCSVVVVKHPKEEPKGQ